MYTTFRNFLVILIRLLQLYDYLSQTSLLTSSFGEPSELIGSLIVSNDSCPPVLTIVGINLFLFIVDDVIDKRAKLEAACKSILNDKDDMLFSVSNALLLVGFVSMPGKKLRTSRCCLFANMSVRLSIRFAFLSTYMNNR